VFPEKPDYRFPMGKRTESAVLKTALEVIAALGGYSAVEALTGADYKRVWDWGKDGHFPPRYHLLMSFELAKKGRRARPSLWGMVTTPEIERAVA